jgi:anti-anti-sigma factor
LRDHALVLTPFREAPSRECNIRNMSIQISLAQGHDADARVDVRCISGQVAIVELFGDHGIGQSGMVRHALEAAARRRRNVLVDLSHCGFVDSTIVRTLLHGSARVDAFGGRFALVVPAEAERVARVAEIMGLRELFPLYSTLEGALATFVHTTRVRDGRLRVGDDECFVADCACGWRGEPRTGPTAWRAANDDAQDHGGNRPARARRY